MNENLDHEQVLHSQSLEIVSVVIATRNDSQRVGSAIVSVLQQSATLLELIVIDDASTDSTANVLELYKNFDSRVKVITNPKQLGRAGARNAGIKVAKGEYICVLDSDDIMLPDRLAIQTEFMRRNPDIGLIGSHAIFEVNGKYMFAQPPCSPHAIRQLLTSGQNNAIINSSLFVRKTLFVENGGYKSSVHSPIYNEDYITFNALVDRTQMANIPLPLIIVNTDGIINPAVMKNKLREMHAYEEDALGKGFTVSRLLRLIRRKVVIYLPDYFFRVAYSRRINAMPLYRDVDFIIELKEKIERVRQLVEGS